MCPPLDTLTEVRTEQWEPKAEIDSVVVEETET